MPLTLKKWSCLKPSISVFLDDVSFKTLVFIWGRGYGAMGKRGDGVFGGLIITSRIEYLNAGASLETSINIMLHDSLN
jgi:hypothetical protein